MLIIGFQSTTLEALEDSGQLRFDIAVLRGILSPRINVPVTFTTQDISAQGDLNSIPEYCSCILNSTTQNSFIPSAHACT